MYKAARDFITPGRAITSGSTTARKHERVRDFMRLLGPQYVERISITTRAARFSPISRVDEESRKADEADQVKLPSGGSIVIETTEALTVIDVNSGKFTGGQNLDDTIVKTNIEAAAEIARQVRLRDIGGIIVCDFIDMSSESTATRSSRRSRTGLRKDRTRSTIQSFSPLGLLEFTRKRVGKDLAGQLRSTCPTCHGPGKRDVAGVGDDLDVPPESGTTPPERTSRSRHVEAHRRTSPRRWSSGTRTSCTSSSESIGRRSTFASMPQRIPSIRIWSTARSTERSRGRSCASATSSKSSCSTCACPIATSALAVVNGRLIEVENAAEAAGQAIKIRILDVDGADMFAEPMTPVAAAAETRRRRRRGRGAVKPISPEEQADELRELAEEAARGAEVRAGIGISTAAEAEAEEAIAKTPKLGPDIVGRSVGGGREDSFAEGALEEGQPRRRRRRRRRRGRGQGAEGGLGTAAAVQTTDVQATVEAPAAETEAEPGLAAASWPPDGDEAQRRPRRRRRRRRRAHAGPAQDGTPRAVPDRHIFRVNPDGSLVATGETAPAEPSRAIAPWRQTAGHVAIEAPPPALSAPPAPVDGDVRVTKPTRRRAAAPRKASVSIEGTQMPALPSGEETAEKPKRKTRKAATVEADAKPKRTRRTKASAESAEAEAPKKRATRTRKKAEGAEA